MHRTTAQCNRFALPLSLTVLALQLTAGGCGREDSASRAIAEAKTHLVTAGAGGSAAAPKDVLEKKFKEAIASLKPGEGSDSSKALQSAIEAGALTGQGDAAAGTYRRADARLLASLNKAKARLNLYTDQRALATALEGYDPKADIASFDDQINERERELAEAKKAHAANLSKVEALRADAGEKASRGQSMMQSVGALRQQLMDAQPVDRAALALQLNTARREAELVMKDSELVDADAARIAPHSGELALLVQQAERQIASLNAAKDRARALAKSRAETSAEAARGAEQTAGEVVESISEVRRVLDEEVKPAFDAAIAKLTQAAGKFAQSRGGADQRLLTLMNGTAAQAVGSLQREGGESTARVATILEIASKAKPPIAGASEWAQAAQTLREQSKQAFETALEQYEKAKSALDSAGGSGDVKERIEALAARVEQTRIRLGGKAPEAPAPEAAPEAAPSEGDSAPAKTTGETPAEGMAPIEEGTPAETPESNATPASEKPAEEPK